MSTFFGDAGNGEISAWNNGNDSLWDLAVALPIWLIAGAVPFLPFAAKTSPWDAVTLHVPGNQGNWWHVLVGLPFFLAYPMIWLRIRPLFSKRSQTTVELRLISCAATLSVLGTLLVELPFLRHLAGTSEWQRLVVLGLGLGVILASVIALFAIRRRVSFLRLSLIGLNSAYLANLALCLVVYGEATGTVWSRLGWFISIVTVWPILIDLASLFLRSSAPRP